MPVHIVKGDALHVGQFFTDGARLYRVVETGDKAVAMENCRIPDERPCWFPVSRVLEEMDLVQVSDQTP